MDYLGDKNLFDEKSEQLKNSDGSFPASIFSERPFLGWQHAVSW